MRAYLPGILVAAMLCVVVALDASAARKKSEGDTQRPPRDSVVWIPRVTGPPNLVEFLQRAMLGKRAAKAEPGPERPRAGGSRPDSSRVERSPKPPPDSLPGPASRSEPVAQRLADPVRDSSTVPPPDPAPPVPPAARVPPAPPAPPAPAVVPPGSASDTARSRAGIDTAGIPSPEVSIGSLAPADPPPQDPELDDRWLDAPAVDDDPPVAHATRSSTTVPAMRGSRAWERPAVRDSRSLDSSRAGAGIVPLPPRAPGSPVAAGPPPEPPPAGPGFGPRDPLRGGPADWMVVAGAMVLIVWTGISLLQVRRRRRARHASRELGEAPAAGSRWNGDANGAAGATPRGPARRPAPARSVDPAAGTTNARGRRRVRRMLLSNLWRVKGSLLLAGVFMLGGAAVELLKPWPLKIVLDHVILAKPLSGAPAFLQQLAPDGIRLLVGASIAIVVVSVVGGLFSYLQVFITKALGYRMVYALRLQVFAHFQRLSLSFHNRARTGDLLTTFSKDTDTLKSIFADALLKFVDHSVSMIGMLVIMWFVNWKTCVLALATLPFLCFTLMHLYRQTKISLKKQRKQEGRVVSRMSEVLNAVPLVQAFGREEYEEQRYQDISNETLNESIRMTRLEAAASRSTHIMSAIGTALVVLVGGIEVLQGRMLPGELVLVMAYVTSMYKPLRNLAKLSIEVSKASASAERIAEILDVEPEIRDHPDAIDADGIRGEIRFATVSFDYGDGRPVLHHLSFEVEPGQRVALIGVSGAGKSTIASLILRLYDVQRGVILIDGMDITRYRLESLRRQIGIVLQDSLLFGATIRENIAYGRPDATLDEIMAAARTANADEFIRELEDGYESIIGERGVTLSAGQRQRIAIARAVVRDPRILILDEPMTGLDAESESKVHEALDRLMAGRTTIFITHDLASIADADQVLVLDEGRIIERGTYAQLMRRNGRYRELFDIGLQSAAPRTAKP